MLVHDIKEVKRLQAGIRVSIEVSPPGLSNEKGKILCIRRLSNKSAKNAQKLSFMDADPLKGPNQGMYTVYTCLEIAFFDIEKRNEILALYLQQYLLTLLPNSLRVLDKEMRCSGPSDRRKSAPIVFGL